mgnify:CR=1 FL=1
MKLSRTKMAMHVLGKFALGLFVSLLLAGSTYAQTTVSGRVTADDGEPLPGVNILFKGTGTGTITDLDGSYMLATPGTATTLVFSYIGYKSQEVEIGNRTTIDVVLESDFQNLEQVVVIGYGTQRRADVTTAVASVKPEEFVPGAVRNVGELLRGKVAGLSLSTPSGDPEANTEILLRGITSIFGSSEPLVLIDGYPGNLNVISPNDIESVEVLKDASASAIYGTRGKNGVILISTKKARGIMDPVIEYSTYIATDRFLRTADFMDATDVRNAIARGVITPAYDFGTETNWLDEITRVPFNQFHNLSFRAGTGKTRYTANASYQDAEGIFIGSDNREFKLRMDIDHYFIKDKLKANVNVLKGLQKYGPFSNGIYRQALIRNPTDGVVDDNGNWIERIDQFQYENPVSLLRERRADNSVDWTWLTGSLSYFPVNGLELKIVGSQHQTLTNNGIYQTMNHISTVRDGRNGLATVSYANTTEHFLDLTADYAVRFNQHRITALAGYSYIDLINSGFSMTNYDFPTDLFSYHSIQQGNAIRNNLPGSGINSYKNDWKLIGFFGRLGYGFADKYNILASVRYEGSSRFGADRKWGLFPSLSAGWTISNEPFFKDIAAITNLKIRGGYGRTGSISTNPYQSLIRYSFSATQFYFNGTEWVNILNPVANPNPNLGWEVNTEYNLGVDFAFFKGRMFGSLDLYDRTLEDLAFSFPVPVPPNLVGTTVANAARMTNRGMELALNYVVADKGKFEWTTNMNYSRNDNRLAGISSDDFKLENDFFFAGGTGDPIQLSTHKLEVGRPIGDFFGYKSVGIVNNPSDPTRDGTWLIESANGELKSIVDANPNDRQILGNGLPQWYLAFNNYFRYGAFDLNVTMRGAFDYQILNFQRMFYENPLIVYNRLNSAFDEIDGKLLRSPQSYVSHYIEDGDFFKIDNVTLGYTFRTSEASAVKSARAYVAASNLAVITAYQGLDPEVSRTGLAPGNDGRDKYPTMRTFTLGLDLRF